MHGASFINSMDNASPGPKLYVPVDIIEKNFMDDGEDQLSSKRSARKLLK
tara:strand:+ start:120 stop:269 length:150 start_codon:yes stop_codon:yes gene_type:complete